MFTGLGDKFQLQFSEHLARCLTYRTPLRSLSLVRLTIQGADLIHVLSACRDTLTELFLYGVAITTGSWTTVLNRLREPGAFRCLRLFALCFLAQGSAGDPKDEVAFCSLWTSSERQAAVCGSGNRGGVFEFSLGHPTRPLVRQRWFHVVGVRFFGADETSVREAFKAIADDSHLFRRRPDTTWSQCGVSSSTGDGGEPRLKQVTPRLAGGGLWERWTGLPWHESS
jgi:hypothetical protein